MYSGYETDFHRVEKAVQLASEIIKLSNVSPIPQALVDLVSYGSKPSPTTKQISDRLQESLDKWEQKAVKMGSLIPLSSIPNSRLDIHKTQLTMLQEWAKTTGEHLEAVCGLTKEILESCKSKPQNYKQLLEDIRKAEDVRHKEGDFLAE